MRSINLVYFFFELCPLNIENSHLRHIFMSTLFRERLIQLPFGFILTEIWHLLDVSAMAGHAAVLAVLLFKRGSSTGSGLMCPQLGTLSSFQLHQINSMSNIFHKIKQFIIP